MQVCDNAPSYNMGQHESAQQQNNNESKQLLLAERTTITVHFIAFTAEELDRMVTRGELPPTIHGADVIMQNPNNKSQHVSINFIY